MFYKRNTTTLKARSSFSLLILHFSLDFYNKEFRGIYNIVEPIQTIQILNYQNLTTTFYKYLQIFKKYLELGIFNTMRYF